MTSLRHQDDLHGDSPMPHRLVAQREALATEIMLEPAVQMLARLRDADEGTIRDGGAGTNRVSRSPSKQTPGGERGPRSENGAACQGAAMSGRGNPVSGVRELVG